VNILDRAKERSVVTNWGVSLSAIAFFAFFLRLWGISQRSLWFDEGFSIWFSSQSNENLLGFWFNVEPNPPLYYLLLKGWRAIFGDSELALRSLSAVFGAATAVGVAFAVRWIAPTNVARHASLLAAALFSLDSVDLYYSQEARVYALFAFFLSVTLAAFAYVYRQLYSAHDTRLVWFVALSASAALVVWSHYIGLIYIFLFGLTLFCWWLVSDRSRHVFVGLVVCAALFLLFSSVPILRSLRLSDANTWIQVPTAQKIASQATLVFGTELGLSNRPLELAARFVLFAPWPVIGFVYLWRNGGVCRPASLVCLVLSFGVVFCISLISLCIKPLLLLRTIMAAQVGWIVLCAFAPFAFRGHSRLFAATGVLVVFGLGGLAYSAGYAKGEYLIYEDWRGVARAALESSNGNIHLLSNPGGATLLDYYLKGSGIVVTPIPRALSSVEVVPPIEVAAEQVIAELRADRKAWLVLRTPDAEPLYDKLASANVMLLFQMGQVGVFRAK
jgi:4-amino-4-deoxy-L-arabinose transferase-like glycosyltransferase